MKLNSATSINRPPALRDYLVTVFQPLLGGALAALVLRVSVDQPIAWVKSHANQIAEEAIQREVAKGGLNRPIVALNVEPAESI